MYCTIIRRHCVYISTSRTQVCRGLWSSPQKPRLVKTEKFKIYRLQEAGFPNVKFWPKLNEVSEVPLKSRRISRWFYKLFTVIFSKNSTTAMPPIPPEATRGMKILDRGAFKTTVDVPTVAVPVKHIGPFQKKMKKYFFKMQGIKPVAELGEATLLEKDKYKLFLFDPDKFKTKEDFHALAKDEVEEFGIDLSTWQVAEIELEYANWHYDEILRAIIPEESDGVGGFSVIGHILHLNLKDELLPYRDIIGEVLLDKVPKVETVVNKTNTIDNTYRNFAMEVIAGKNDFIASAKSNGHSFKMDFSKVYWNPRLNTEHQRILDQLKKKDIVYDVFAGIGPFSVPAAKKGCFVFANDLNPESYKWLQTNMTENKVKSDPQLFNLDGRDFIRTIIKADLIKRWSEESHNGASSHVVMNLPALAVEFLDAFLGLMKELKAEQCANILLPRVHCYTFSKAADPVAEVKERIEATLCSPLPTDHVIRIVRNVAPNKEMLCAEFEMPREVLFSRSTESEGKNEEQPDENVQPPEKRSRMES